MGNAFLCGGEGFSTAAEEAEKGKGMAAENGDGVLGGRGEGEEYSVQSKYGAQHRCPSDFFRLRFSVKIMGFYRFLC